MADDARISTALPRHPKTVKLQRRLGAPGCWSLVCLFLWVAENRPTGDLKGMSGEDIEIAANWPGDTGSLVHTLAEVRFLDGQEGAYKIHDWAEHNPWAATRPQRTEAAKKAAAVRWESKHAAIEPDAKRIRPVCGSHETAMPSSPLLTPPPDTTSNPPPLKESVFDLTENAREASEGPNDFHMPSRKNYDPEVGLAIDLRKLAKAFEEIELKLTASLGSGTSPTEKEVFEWACELAGISVRRGHEVQRLGRQWPTDTELEASA
jgi:hypothetical protein